MLNDVAWRKMPTDILTNENMTYIESQMPEEFQFAPYMFYMAALKKADDDGIFDLEDGMIFARLMRVPSADVVFKIANLMGSRKIIGRVSANSNVCFFVDWEYTANKTKTWQQRREAIQIRINDNEQFKKLPNFDDKAPEVPFSSFECDKNKENVSQTVIVTKNNENVTQTTKCDENTENCHTLKREREKERKREKKDTHTEREKESVRERERDVSASGELIESSPEAPTREKKPLATDNAETEKEVEACTNPESINNNLAYEALNSQNDEQKTEGGKLEEVVIVLQNFFSGQFGYDIKKGRRMLENMSKDIIELETSEFPATVIAQTMLKEFQKMHDSEGHWKNIPLQPVYMAKAGVWAHLLEYVGKTLVKNSKKNTFIAKAKEYQAASEAEKDSLDDEIKAEYKKYGIDPDDPLAFKKVADARAKAKAGPPDIPEDIF